MIVIIGAGPAGLAAAEAAARSGEAVTLLDSAPRFGGQYWRHREKVSGYKAERSTQLFEKIRANKSITWIPSATVWSAEQSGSDFRINYLVNGDEASLLAEKVILATGAYDRSLPFPGWDSPGAMTPGAAQALLKGHGVVAGQRIIVSGTGPFLLTVATGLAEAGAEIVGLYEAQSPLRWLLSPQALLGNFKKFPELMYYQRLLRKYGIKQKFGRAVVKFHGGKATIARVNSKLSIRSGVSQELACDVVAAGWGFQPDLSLGGLLGCSEKIDRDGTVIFEVDREQRSSVPNIWIAGEATGIGGADLALIEGEIAGLSATNQKIPSHLIRSRASKRRFAKALMRSYPVRSGWTSWLEEETTICRCEEVKVAEVSESISQLGAEDSRGAKLFTRCGMGLCQGRICSRNVSEFISSQTGTSVLDSERIAYSNRPIAAPISLGELADGKSGR